MVNGQAVGRLTCRSAQSGFGTSGMGANTVPTLLFL
jgi:hypothetical protein